MGMTKVKDLYKGYRNNLLIKKFKWSPPFRHLFIEQWLKEMNDNGWKLVSCSFFSVYTFIYISNIEVEFFLFSYDPKKRCANWIFHSINDTYKLKRSKLKNCSNNEIIIIDTKKIDDKFYYYKFLRDQYTYKNMIKWLILFVIICFIWIVIAMLFDYIMAYFWTILSFIGIVYNIVGVVYLRKVLYAHIK